MDYGFRKNPLSMVHSLRKNGFTLVEILIVVACLSLLMLAAAPQDNLGNIHVEGAALRLEQDFRYARELALTKNINCGLQISPSGDYLVYETSVSNPALNPLTQKDFDYNLSNDFPGVNVVNVLSPLQIEFNSLGQPVLGSGSIIQVGDGTTTISLQITPSTGWVQRL